MIKTFRTLPISPKTIAMTGHAIQGIIYLNVLVYVSSLFLANYPSSWIPYFLLLQPVARSTPVLFLPKLLKKNPQYASIIIRFLLAITILIMTPLLIFKWYIFPLILCFFLTGVDVSTTVLAWNSVQNAFNVAEFKPVSQAVTIAFTLGVIFAGFVNVVLLRQYGANSLPYIISVLLFISCGVTYALKPLPVIQKNKKKPFQLRHSSLFINLFKFGILLAFCYTATAYLLQAHLKAEFTQKEIATFMSELTVTSSIIGIILSYIALKPLIKRGIYCLLFILPFYWVILSSSLVIFPKDYFIYMIAAGTYIFYRNFTLVGEQMFLHVFPGNIRTSASPAITTVAEAIGATAMALCLIIFSQHLSLLMVGSVICVTSLFLVFFTRRLEQDYISTLKNEIFLKRFDFTTTTSKIKKYRKIIESKIVELLGSSKDQTVCSGYSLLSTSKIPFFPPEIFNHIHSDSKEVRLEAIKYIKQHNKISAEPALAAQLKVETDADVKELLICALGQFNPMDYQQQALLWLNDNSPKIQAGAITVLCRSNDPKIMDSALSSFKKLHQQSNICARRAAARILNSFPLSESKILLPDFIADPDDIVSAHAVCVVTDYKLYEFLPNIVDRLATGGILYESKKLLVLQRSAIPLLTAQILKKINDPLANIDSLVSALATVQHTDAENALIELASQPHVLLRQIVSKEAIKKARQEAVSHSFTQKAYTFALEEAELIQALNNALSRFSEKHIFNEIMNRLDLARLRYLHWVGVNSFATEILGLIPTILTGVKSEQAKAIELLSKLIDNKTLSETTLHLFSELPVKQSIVSHKPEADYLDAWIVKTVKTSFPNNREITMNTMQKVFILREIELFKDLPGEILFVIAEETETISMSAGETLFLENDPSAGLFMIASGSVQIIRNGTLLSDLTENNFFGELGLLDNAPRLATAKVVTDGVLLYLDQETFKRITNDIPKVMNVVVSVVLRYLRGNMSLRV
ncbi:MAG: cyclic nucleotide-binding domain-containing protein [Legionella sp.]|nr:cyclic nucleotide-binding domain-containing protein [Legionella sp.]